MSTLVRDIPVQGENLSLWMRMVLTVTDAAMYHLYPRFTTGLEHYTATPATLVVSNHRRDNDGPLLASVLLRRQDGRFIAPIPHFAAREDLFERGFLAHYLRRCPASLRPLLKMIDLSPCLVGAYPLQRTHECSVAKALQDVITYLGDMPATEALRPQSLRNLATKLKFDPQSFTISQLLHDYEHKLWRRHYGYRHLRLAVFRRIRPHLHDLIDHQIDHFTQLLEHGQVLILEPEGRLSLDGALRRPRAALHELINRPNRPVRVLPISITYDPLTTGRRRIFIDIQPELSRLGGVSRRVLDDRVTASIRFGCRVTGSQLVAGFLLSLSGPRDAWSERTLIRHVHAAAQRCYEAAIPVDPCLQNQQDCELRTRDILAWGHRTGFLASKKKGWLHTATPGLSPPWLPGGRSTLLGYLRAELLETVGEVRARDLELLPWP